MNMLDEQAKSRIKRKWLRRQWNKTANKIKHNKRTTSQTFKELKCT